MAPLAGNKRKVDYNAPGTSAQVRKRQKGKDARAIPTQTADAALSKTGELNIASFVKAREFEIAALQQSMKKSRKSLTQRAFQQVPRHMRRRTASHNVKKIPRRLRARALREIKEDNTPTGSARKRKLSSKLRLRLETAKRLQKLNATRKSVRQKKREAKSNAKEADPEKHKDVVRVPRIKKNKLVIPPQATSKFKRRQVNKTWLPTHLWHTKRAHMTRPTLPLWRMAIPLRPTEKSYRPTHRAAGARGCIAWDASYISTVGCQGTESALEGMLKALGFAGGHWTGSKYIKWKTGTRHSEGWAFERDKRKTPIAPITVLWQIKPAPEEAGVVNSEKHSEAQPTQQKHVKLDRRIFIRIHPSAFHHFWTELLAAAKTQKPQVLVEDLRFEIGSIIVQGPQSTETLAGVLKLSHSQPQIESVWPTLSAINNPATLPLNLVLTMNVIDPRLNHPPKQASVRRDDQSLNKLNETIVSWPLEKTLPPSTLFDHKTRYAISKSLPSQKAINRRRAGLLPGQQVENEEKDPQIPAILLAHRSSSSGSKAQGSWTVLLPWSCVDLIWRSLMYYPLTTGNTPRFGGLEQTQQVAFEQCIPWYPADCPGTEAGKAWDRTESENRFDKWLRRPPSKRYAWDAIDLGLGRKGELGRGWACDWEYLFRDSTPTTKEGGKSNLPIVPDSASKSTQPRLLTQRQRKAAAVQTEKEKELQARRRNSSSPESDDGREKVHNDVKFGQVLLSEATALMKSYQESALPQDPVLATIRIKLLTRGTPSATARIYRLPTVRPLIEKNKSQSRPTNNQSSEPSSSNSIPVVFTDSSSGTSDAAALRPRWLELDSNPFGEQANPRSSTSLPNQLRAEKTNRNGDPVSHAVYDPKHARDLSRIRVFPPRETNPEVLNMFGPRPPPRTEEEFRKLLQPQLVPKMTVDSRGDLVVEELWDKHVPCPGPEDLIGYVTTGGYNLVEGRGTAIGAIWIQKVVSGWKEEDQPALAEKALNDDGAGDTQNNVATLIRTSSPGPVQDLKKAPINTKKDQVRAKAQKQRQQSIERDRHLCIVRNSGESIGRLALWELC